MVISGAIVTTSRQRSNIIDRLRLYRLLDGWDEVRAVLVQAPAGYGKTTLAKRWIETAGLDARVVWLSLSEQEAGPRDFVARFAAALDQLLPGTTADLQLALGSSSTSPEQAWQRLMQALADAPEARSSSARLLVLDDLHRAASPAVGELLRAWLEHGPAQIHLLLLTRHLADLPLARFVAHGEVLALDTDDLRFNREEIRQYLAARGISGTSDADLMRLVQMSEGWITAIQLAVLSDRSSGKLPPFAAERPRDRQWIASFLANEVLDNQPPDLRRFLLETAILEQFNLSLCQAVTGREDAGSKLAEIEEHDLFLVRLDNGWYRYHHLFQEQLQQRLAVEQTAAEVAELHRRAARWLEREGDDDGVIGHLLAANLDEEAAVFMEQRMWQTLAREPERTLRLLRLLPDQQWKRRPRLLIDRCLIALFVDDERFAERVREAEEALASSGMSLEDNPRLAGRWKVVQCACQLIGSDHPAAIRLAREARALEPEMDPFSAGTLNFLDAWLAYHTGRAGETDRLAEQAIDIYEQAPFPLGALAVRRQQARWSHLRGNGDQAGRQYEWLDKKVAIHSDTAHEYVAMLILAADHHYWRNNLSRAADYAGRAASYAWQLANDELIYCAEVQRQLCDATGQPELPAIHPYELYHERFPSAFWRRFIIEMDIRRLMAGGRPAEAWQLARELGLDPEAPATPHAYTVVPFLEAALAAGVEQPLIDRLLPEALAHFEGAGQRFYQLRLLALRAWSCLRQDDREQAGRLAMDVLALAEETGYLRVVIDTPGLLGLLPRNRVAALREIGENLTRREIEVISYLSRGCSYLEIADEMHVSINTVRTHIRNIYEKLSVSDRSAAVAVAVRSGLVAE